MTKSQTPLPPDIRVTRADVLALPCVWAEGEREHTPAVGNEWVVTRDGDRLVWVEVTVDTPRADRAEFVQIVPYEGRGPLTAEEAAIAERAFLWQTALASDAALADIGNDPVPTAPPVVVHGDLIATIRSTIAEETAKAIRHVTDGAKA